MSPLKPRYRSYADGSVRFLTQDNWISVNASPEASNAEAGIIPVLAEAADGPVSGSVRTQCPSPLAHPVTHTPEILDFGGGRISPRHYIKPCGSLPRSLAPTFTHFRTSGA